jgi:hypothetical protein
MHLEVASIFGSRFLSDGLCIKVCTLCCIEREFLIMKTGCGNEKATHLMTGGLIKGFFGSA